MTTLITNIIELIITAGAAAIMSFAYYKIHSTLTYNRNFNITLFMISLVTLVLFDAIEGNMNVSVGMLGALSIVRFRTNVKDIRDIVFVLWSLAIGIICSTANYEMAYILSIVSCGFLILTCKQGSDKAQLLVLRGSNSDISHIETVIADHYKTITVKAKNLLSDSYELVYEVQGAKEVSTNIEREMFTISGVDSLNLLASNTEVA